jgi:membrane protease YdiL (CAAX protease family)
MKRFVQSEVGATVIWVFCSVVMAAVISPWVYQAGRHFAATAAAQDLPSFLESLGASCGRANFTRFFDRSLLFSAMVLLPVLLRRIKTLRAATETGLGLLWTRVHWKSATLQVVIGCLIAGGMLWGVGVILEALGAYLPKANTPALGKLLPQILIPAVVEEYLFRGLLLGLWLRFSRPAAACLGTSLLFAFLHFLKPPFRTPHLNPSHALAGFQRLGKIFLNFTDPLFFVTDFATLLGVGLILAWARVRTGALWFSIGLHAGWILAFKGFNLLYQKVPGHPLFPWGVGESLRSGIVPLCTLGLTAVICHFVLRRFETGRTPPLGGFNP